jgi:hypothetical protein
MLLALPTEIGVVVHTACTEHGATVHRRLASATHPCTALKAQLGLAHFPGRSIIQTIAAGHAVCQQKSKTVAK